MISVHGLYTRIKYFPPPSNCVIRHSRVSISSSKFIHQLFQRTAMFWASFDVSPYFIIFVDTFTNHFFNSGKWLCVYKWQSVYLTLTVTCTCMYRCVGIVSLYTDMYEFKSWPTWISRNMYKKISNSFLISLVCNAFCSLARVTNQCALVFIAVMTNTYFYFRLDGRNLDRTWQKINWDCGLHSCRYTHILILDFVIQLSVIWYRQNQSPVRKKKV